MPKDLKAGFTLQRHHFTGMFTILLQRQMRAEELVWGNTALFCWLRRMGGDFPESWVLDRFPSRILLSFQQLNTHPHSFFSPYSSVLGVNLHSIVLTRHTHTPLGEFFLISVLTALWGSSAEIIFENATSDFPKCRGLHSSLTGTEHVSWGGMVYPACLKHTEHLLCAQQRSGVMSVSNTKGSVLSELTICRGSGTRETS